MAYLAGELQESVRLAELAGALSLASDMGNGQPPETAIAITLLALNMGRDIGLLAGDLETVYWGGLLRFSGCVATSVEEQVANGDDIGLRRALLGVDFGNPPDLVQRLNTALGQEAAGRFLQAAPELAPPVLRSHCDIAVTLGRRLGLRDEVTTVLAAYHERWDGGGPFGLAGESIPLASRLLAVAQSAVTNARVLSPSELRVLMQLRAGSHLDPDLVQRFVDGKYRAAGDVSVWHEVMDAEPGGRRRVMPGDLTELARVLGDHSDLKSPYTLGHARGVARLASEAARSLGLDEVAVERIEQASLLHDVGRAGVSSAILEKPGPLNPVERERARSHAYETERILTTATGLAPLGRLAASNHERLDGSGYPHHLSGTAIGIESRVITAADALQGLVEDRAYRSSMGIEQAAAMLRQEAAAGRLDSRATEAVIATATGVATRGRRSRGWPAGLSDREVEVLRLVARGMTNREVAETLVISPRTVQQHTVHIYDKIGVSTRAAATLFAAENELFSPLLPR